MNLFKPSLTLAIFVVGLGAVVRAAPEVTTGNMVKMCLFYSSPSGHARTDPILSQTCSSDHVHTFYGPQNFHPNTNYEDLRDIDDQFSSTPFVENQSLYWHPSIYRKEENEDGMEIYARVSVLDSSPYYRWDNSVLPRTEAFPPGFRMIAYSDQPGANQGGEHGKNLYVECIRFTFFATHTNTMRFPTKNCDEMGIAFAMPTCWNGELGIDNNHRDHMAYTVDGTVSGACPEGYDRRLPQVQMFVRIENYLGGEYEYTLADESDVFHFDFMNGWEEGKLQHIIDNCPVVGDTTSYNPDCTCDEEFLTSNYNTAGPVCDDDVKNLILDEATDVVSELPRGSCSGPEIIPKSWSLNPPLDHINMEIEIKGDGESNEHKNKWALVMKQGDDYQLVSGLKKIKEREKKWTVSCLLKTECYILRIIDSGGDGIIDGYYNIYFGDEEINGEFLTGRKHDVWINCD